MAAKNTQLTTEFANHQRDVFNPQMAGGILSNLDTVLQLRGGNIGLAIYDELERDAQVFSVLQKRKMAVIAKEWEIKPASTSLRDRKAAELVDDILDSVPFDRLCLNLLEATLKGYSVVEIIWALRDNLIVPVKFIPRDPRRFVFDQDRNPRLLTRENMHTGEELPPRKFIVHSTGAKDGSPYGRGLGHQLFSKVMFKNQGLGFWVAYADRFGSPTAVGEFPATLDAEGQKNLLNALMAAGQETSIVMPQGTLLQLLEPKSNTTTYEPLLKYLDEQISIAVLGETMTTQGGGGGLGGNQSAVHNDVRKELCEADSDLLSDTLNDTLLRWIVELNLPNAAAPRVERDFSESIDLKALAERDKILFEIGYKPTLKYIQDTYDGEFEAIAAPITPTGKGAGLPPLDNNAPAFAEAAPRFTPTQQAIEDRTDAALSGLELGIPDDDIKQAIRDASDPEDLSARLAVLLQYSDSAKFDAVLSKALFAADVMGYVHAG